VGDTTRAALQRQPLLQGSVEVVVEMVEMVEMTPAPKYVEATAALEKVVAGVTAALTRLQALQHRRLQCYGDGTAVLELEIAQVTAAITQQLTVLAAAVAAIGKVSATTAPGDRAIRNNIQRAKRAQVQALTAAFHKAQQQYKSELNGLQARSGGSFHALIGGSRAAAAGGDAFTDLQLAVVEEAEVLVADRAREIAAVCSSIDQIAALMRDLHCMVHEQGGLIDRVDANMLQAVDRTRAGVTQLQQAQKHQRAGGKFAAACIVVLAVLSAVCMLVLVLRKM
jgi:syntaxin 16